MIVTIDKPMIEAIGFQKFAPYDLGKDDWSWRDTKQINLATFDNAKLEALKELLTKNKDIDGAAALARDIKTWLAAKADIKGTKPRTVKQFHALLAHYLLGVEGHRVYEKDDDVWLAYYVASVLFEDANIRTQTPANVTMRLVYEDFGGRQSTATTFYFEDIRGKTIVEALLGKGYVAEVDELREAHLRYVEKFDKIAKEVGKQFYATGFASTGVDGNGKHSRYNTDTVSLTRDGAPGRVVIDVFHEEADRDMERSVVVDPTYWKRVKAGKADADEEEHDDGTSDEHPEIPLHPFCAIFDLTKHLRLRTHVSNLTEYIYDDRLSDKLILNETMKSLVEMLVDHKDGGFRDIVAGKGGGAVVLLGGEPGVGKTLTAEVYAESKHMALYNVQCSQLGTSPDKLEATLLKVFSRAKRWGAIVLLDEADVYVRERGDDLAQNAIVGVFLRVLEYQSSVLFLATNRPDDVDDAVASRCLARLDYKRPDATLEAKIWRVLASSAGAKISEMTILKIVDSGGGRTGRDVKNLLKLAMLVNKGKKENEITQATISFVEQFRPWKKS